MNQARLRFRSDCDKKPLEVGDTVRVCGIPDLSEIYEEGRERTTSVFKYALGRTFKIESFDNWNCAVLQFYIPLGPAEGRHGIAIEPFLLKRANAKSNT